MEIVSEFKTTFKKSYKSIKKEITKYLKKLGFSKKQTYKVSGQIVNDMYGTIGRYIQREINAEIKPKNLQQKVVSKKLQSFDWRSSLPSFNEATINSEFSNQMNDLLTYQQATAKLPTYEETVADIIPFDEERASKYKAMLNEVNIFFAKKTINVLESTSSSCNSLSKNLRPLFNITFIIKC